ncbi:MAG: YdbH domain-containing protein [Thermodesulfovibrionales bacterium]|nr:YdbH domain-containing protein [Thermodesulfovibrionales bacterium]
MKKRLVIISLSLLITFTILYSFKNEITSSIIGYLSGYKIGIVDIDLTGGRIERLTIRSQDIEGFVERLEFSDTIKSLINYRIDVLFIKNPRLNIIHTPDRQTNLSFLKNMPTISHFNISKGLISLSDKGSNYNVKLTDVEINIRDYSPKKGGIMRFSANIQGNLIGNVDISGNINGTASIGPSQNDIILNGNLEIEFHNIKSESFTAKGAYLKGNFEYKASEIRIYNANTTIDAISVLTKEKDILIRQTNSKLEFDSKKMLINVTDLKTRVSEIGTIKGNISANMLDKLTFSTNLVIEDIDINKGIKSLQSLSLINLQELDLSGKGSIKAEASGVFDEEGFHIKDGLAEIMIKEGAFSSNDGLKMGQGIHGNIKIRFDEKIDIKKNRLGHGIIDGEIKSGEILWDRFYYNHENKPSLTLSADIYKIVNQNGFSATLNTDLLKTGNYKLNINKSSDTAIKGVFTNIRLNEFHGLFLKESISNILPTLEGMSINGVANIMIDMNDTNTSFVFDLNRVDVNIPKINLSAKEIHANIPLHLGHEDKKIISQGQINIKSLRLGVINTTDITIPLQSTHNRISSLQPVSVGVFDGTVQIQNLKIDTSDIYASAVFLLDNINLSNLSSHLGLTNLEGLLNGKIDVTTYEKNKFRSQGSIFIDVFGGLVKIKDIYGDLSFKNVGADISFDDIDLEKLTHTIRFGKMTGIIYGSINNLLIQYGQAGRFILDINSKRKEGIKQTVSTDAIENISILGTGSEGISRLLSTGLNQFFKEFPYSAIGIHCSLDNDVFTIRGKIKEGGKEYLIRKTFLRGIDVINQNPENNISFKDMQRRLSVIFNNVSPK